jgi:hypothetical protein
MRKFGFGFNYIQRPSPWQVKVFFTMLLTAIGAIIGSAESAPENICIHEASVRLAIICLRSWLLYLAPFGLPMTYIASVMFGKKTLNEISDEKQKEIDKPIE